MMTDARDSSAAVAAPGCMDAFLKFGFSQFGCVFVGVFF